jgi:Fis family transcriptional regulator, factor for inversion stimulation protein
MPSQTEKTMLNTMTQATKEYNVRDSIHHTLTNYFSLLGNQQPSEVYNMVIAEVEQPMIQAVMTYTRNNQSRAAIIMGLSRGTLRKLLKKYGFIE